MDSTIALTASVAILNASKATKKLFMFNIVEL
jgi:hypothetical protein